MTRVVNRRIPPGPVALRRRIQDTASQLWPFTFSVRTSQDQHFQGDHGRGGCWPADQRSVFTYRHVPLVARTVLAATPAALNEQRHLLGLIAHMSQNGLVYRDVIGYRLNAPDDSQRLSQLPLSIEGKGNGKYLKGD